MIKKFFIGKELLNFHKNFNQSKLLALLLLLFLPVRVKSLFVPIELQTLLMNFERTTLVPISL